MLNRSSETYHEADLLHDYTLGHKGSNFALQLSETWPWSLLLFSVQICLIFSNNSVANLSNVAQMAAW